MPRAPATLKDHSTRADSPDVKQTGPASSPRTRKRLSRQELAAGARQAIFAAASKVVGQYGYAEASITRITEAAGIAQVTFYM
jgi:AcrR family transcriptional regulator